MPRRADAALRGFCLLAFAGLILSAAGCGDADEVPKSAVRRIIILTNGDDPFWDAMRAGLEKAEEDLKLVDAGLDAGMDKGDFSDEAQINKLRQYATQTDIAAVAISSVDAKNRGIADAMKELRDKGVHVICIDSDMDRERYKDTRFAYLGTDNSVGGEELGKAAKGLLPDGGRYATFVGLKSVDNAIRRIGGFADGAGEKFTEADSLADGGDENVAQQNVRTVLNSNEGVDCLVGIWAYNAHAIVKVVDERGVRDAVKVVCFDASPLAVKDMADGKIDALIVQNPYDMGYRGTKLMKALIEKDHEAIKELYPSYNPETGKFDDENGDVFNTEIRVVVPDEGSPLTPEMFRPETKFFRFSEFQQWLKERNLQGS